MQCRFFPCNQTRSSCAYAGGIILRNPAVQGISEYERPMGSPLHEGLMIWMILTVLLGKGLVVDLKEPSVPES